MKKRELIYIAVLTLIIAFMDITGIPSAFFTNIQIVDIEPFYNTLMINFLIIGVIAFLYIKILCPKWKLGLTKIGLIDGFKKYGIIGVAVAIVGFIAFLSDYHLLTVSRLLQKCLLKASYIMLVLQ